jgi:flagellar biogenesis protein FliO
VNGLLLATLVQDASPPVMPAEAGSYGLFLFETLLILVGVCVLAWLVLRFGVKRLYGTGAGAGPGGNGPLRVLARLSLEPRRTVYIVDAAGKTLLVGASEAGPLTVLAELDERAVAAAVAAAPRQKSFLEILHAKREKRRPEET